MFDDGSKIAGHALEISTVDLTEVRDAENSSREEPPFLSENDRYQLEVWNRTLRKYPLSECVPHLVTKQAADTPQAIALVAGTQVLTYEELNRRANQLAHLLHTLGVGPNVLVGVCVERSLDMVIGLLGVLKAGGAYVPLDPTFPSERLAFMLKDAQTPVLVTHQSFLERLSSPSGVQVVCLDTDTELLIQQRSDEPESGVSADDLAYVIYTSGSTGQPKGVQITHASLLNLVFWHQRAFDVTASDRATQIASPAFDAIGWELWPHLTSGASVYICDDDVRAAPAALRDWLVEKRITVTFLPTVLAESVIELEWPETSTLRFLLTGADTLYHYPHPTLPFQLINNYGPTEATVLVTSGRVPSVENPDMPPSIGRVIDNTQIYILDEQLRQVPVGTPGELYIGGAGLAQGYLNQPDLTKSRFIAHPFSNEPSARLYKTGDLARYLPDGQIAFMGRADHQIKIRGFRIEPDEIMSVLNKHAAIQQSLVIAREDIPGEKRLVAYIVLADGERVTSSELQEALKVHLPDYMIPPAFVQMKEFPSTTNGKLDRSALPAPESHNILRDDLEEEEHNPTETLVTEIVRTLLKIEQVGLDENFFMLGGHSLLATQIVTHVAETFDVDLTLLTLFNAPTIRQLADEIERRIYLKIEAMSEEEVSRLLG